MADEQRMRQILFNLLANAVGFSPAGETVTLLGRCARPTHRVLGSAIAAPAFPAMIKDKVFDWFETARRHRAIAAPGSASRSCVPSSNCMAAQVTLEFRRRARHHGRLHLPAAASALERPAA